LHMLCYFLEDVLKVMFGIWRSALPSSGSWQSIQGIG
jgi:hypothetical protein